MARKKKAEAATDKPFHPEVSSHAQAVMDGRNVGSKASQKDWVRLVQAQAKGEFVPLSLIDEVFSAAGYRSKGGDAYTRLLGDAKELSRWQKSQRAETNSYEDFKAKHGTREDLQEQYKALKEELDGVAKLLKDYESAFHYNAIVHQKAEAIQRTNKRLFPGGAVSLLQEAGVQ